MVGSVIKFASDVWNLETKDVLLEKDNTEYIKCALVLLLPHLCDECTQ